MALVIPVFTAAQSYGPYPAAGVEMSTTDAQLQALYNHAEECARRNRTDFSSGVPVMVEGGGYGALWIETQPMAGAMYAKRDIEIGVNNQLVFFNAQRDDGRMPGAIQPGSGECWWGALQGYCFPRPAWEMYHWIGKDTDYLTRLYTVLEKYDNYLWGERDEDGNGVLECINEGDMGEDQSVKYHGYDGPFECMDIMGYSFDGRTVLAQVSRELGNGREDEWYAKAEYVKQRLAEYLWRPDRHACFDRDRDNEFIEVLMHNNIRCMYHGVFSQSMADEFIRYHLLNEQEFWTPVPLPSIAANDPKFRNEADNNWSGQPQGLTFQRAIRALENYGHYGEVTMIGRRLLDVLRGPCQFTQQIDPYTGALSGTDGYGPMLLATLEYISHMYGVEKRVPDTLWWSGLRRDGDVFSYRQRWGDDEYLLASQDGRFTASINGTTVFSSDCGVRFVTDVDGMVLGIAGIDTVEHEVTVTVGTSTSRLIVHPNAYYEREPSGEFVLSHAVPFGASATVGAATAPQGGAGAPSPRTAEVFDLAGRRMHVTRPSRSLTVERTGEIRMNKTLMR